MAVLIRLLGDVGLAEEAVQDAFTTALQRWPESGIPPAPAGWIITTARHRAIDWLRRETLDKSEEHAVFRSDRFAEASLIRVALNEQKR